MEKLISSWNNVQFVPEKYIFPPEKRPGNITFSASKSIPVIDLAETASKDRDVTIQKILKAAQEYGFLQVINHGVEEDLMNDTMRVFKEFFTLPEEDKASFYIENPKKNKYCMLYPSSMLYATEDVHLWRDNLLNSCHPLEESIQHWPEKPTRYREVVGAYAAEVKKLGSRILELIGEGLGVESGYFGGKLSEVSTLLVNHYPPCPDPSLTFGVPAHCDPNLITILLQDSDVCGLQVLKDGEWIGVDPLPNAFVVNMGYQMQIISNNKLKSVEHRAVTNSRKARTSVACFFLPSDDSIIEPARPVINARNPPIYKAFKYKEFLSHFLTKTGELDGPLQPFKLQS
ncbi:unnamed protein product [Dovyalis caffra]|uniref:Fe2OG dioxygenase domain-containing protein n=1 Tax=Dovyalis caffra TaxID=77055 RepID=A0AAV1SU93_9ROSI|nr:unnamed protein product [Dovyalis caffra]CAK7357593.1 unnamed protein product [Dovyalis caffra]